MDYEDHFTSDKFGNVYWASFECFVDRDDPMRVPEQVDVVSSDSLEDRGCNDTGVGDGVDNDEPCEELATEDDEGEVSISVGWDGTVTEVADQIVDYMMRPEEMHSLCVWDFVATAEKVCSRKGKGVAVRSEEEDTDGSDGEASGESDIEGVEDVQVPHSTGRRPMKRYDFLPGHKEYNRKHVRMRKQVIVPVPIGPAIPRRD